MSRARGWNTTLSLRREAVWGEPVLSGYRRMPYHRNTLGAEQGFAQSDPTLGLGRDPEAPEYDIITAQGDLTVPMDPRYLGLWLTGLLGNPVTAEVAGPPAHKKHTFRSGTYPLPSYTVQADYPLANRTVRTAGVMVNSMAWQWGRAGAASVTVNLLARGTVDHTAPIAHAADPQLVFTRISRFQGAIASGGQPVADLDSGRLTYSNALEAIPGVRDDGLIDGIDLGITSAEGELVARFSEAGIYDSAVAKTPVDLVFSYTLSTAARLVLTLHETWLPVPKPPVDGPGGVVMRFALRGAKNATAGVMMTAELFNDVDAGVYTS